MEQENEVEMEAWRTNASRSPGSGLRRDDALIPLGLEGPFDLSNVPGHDLSLAEIAADLSLAVEKEMVVVVVSYVIMGPKYHRGKDTSRFCPMGGSHERIDFLKWRKYMILGNEARDISYNK